jgi:hypothetical protein
VIYTDVTGNTIAFCPQFYTFHGKSENGIIDYREETDRHSLGGGIILKLILKKLGVSV